MELIAAIREKYAGGGLDGVSSTADPIQNTIQVNKKPELVWEFVQMDKVHDKQRDIYRLKCIVLAEAGVSHVSGEAAGGKRFMNCEELDLSANGITSWEQVASILRLFPALQTLRLRYSFQPRQMNPNPIPFPIAARTPWRRSRTSNSPPFSPHSAPYPPPPPPNSRSTPATSARRQPTG